MNGTDFSWSSFEVVSVACPKPLLALSSSVSHSGRSFQSADYVCLHKDAQEKPLAARLAENLFGRSRRASSAATLGRRLGHGARICVVMFIDVKPNPSPASELDHHTRPDHPCVLVAQQPCSGSLLHSPRSCSSSNAAVGGELRTDEDKDEADNDDGSLCSSRDTTTSPTLMNGTDFSWSSFEVVSVACPKPLLALSSSVSHSGRSFQSADSPKSNCMPSLPAPTRLLMPSRLSGSRWVCKREHQWQASELAIP